MKTKLAIILLCILLSITGFAQQYGWTTLTSPTKSNLKRIYISGSEVWLLNDTELYHSSNYPSEQFAQQFTGTNFNDFTFLNQSGNIYGWAVGYSSLGARTTETTGHLWTSMSLGGTSTYTCVSFPTTSLGFASGTDKRLHKTVNGGTIWTDAGVVLGFSTVNTLFFVDSNTGYVGTGDPRLAKTTDGGATWIDEGDITGSICDIYFYDSTHGCAVGASDILYYNNGIWTQLNNPIGNSLNSVFFIDANEGWIVGNGGTVLHSTNGGANWTAQSSGTSANLLDVFFTSPTNGYAVGTNGTILHYTILTGIEKTSTQPNVFNLEQNYPNPFKETTTISWQQPEKSHVVLKVYDFTGREVKTLVDGEKTMGKHSVKFEAASLPAGIYFYQIHANGTVETKKMTVYQ